jgi:hypothetical protein
VEQGASRPVRFGQGRTRPLATCVLRVWRRAGDGQWCRLGCYIHSTACRSVVLAPRPCLAAEKATGRARSVRTSSATARRDGGQARRIAGEPAQAPSRRLVRASLVSPPLRVHLRRGTRFARACSMRKQRGREVRLRGANQNGGKTTCSGYWKGLSNGARQGSARMALVHTLADSCMKLHSLAMGTPRLAESMLRGLPVHVTCP